MNRIPDRAGGRSPLADAVAHSRDGIVMAQMLIVAGIERSVASTATCSVGPWSARGPGDAALPQSPPPQPGRVQGTFKMELAGLEPATSWVRSTRS